MKKENYLKIGQVEKQTGIPRSTIHFYLREGLLHPPLKTGQTMAYYDDSHLERLVLIQKMKNELGIPINYIKEKISSMDKGDNQTSTDTLHQIASDDSNMPPSLKERRKNEIISAAVKIFSDKGFYKTKVKDITDSLDMSTGTFYIYFNNKEDLFLEAIDDVVKSIVGGAAKAIMNEKDFVMRMLLRAKVFFEQYSRYSEILNQLRAEMTRDSKWFQERVKGIYQDLTRPLITEFTEAINQGIIRPIDPDLIAYAVTGLIETLSFRMTMDETYTIDRVIGFLIDFFMNGIPVNLSDEQNMKIMAFLEEIKP